MLTALNYFFSVYTQHTILTKQIELSQLCKLITNKKLKNKYIA